ncbi:MULTISPECIES: 3-hydroxyacyl-CoA dehydrogenase family protein [Streptomyces]|nr:MULTISPECIES: 3-hydroxyacyl-CoA dehydrogenase family protein [Streptomyces]MBP5865277.1 3-hydroxyacyl-CoA dehydrogenase family protein [Streptomyces sp. LBUM 1484]MBP5872255.1 3-hydroxyacyl-CoA dehydrogenase family protein [Streptomyces sp. LBUM 1485]MBP5933339.1 3-hydroxyacyl-CoA dehydrogenase family protein [Streptomyces sp. LBUM 1479]KFG05442.1 oxidoreductase [Streptomyces scabiei]MBP5874031.1 3-hydroxyacyl-CoA dehydrogenase family protein [Streptomyces sp. LBUM 1477]
MTPHKPVVGIVGLGTVGRALLDMLRDTGHEVIGFDSDPAALARLNGRPTADGPAPVHLVAEIAQLGRADLVIEAVSEDEAVKSEMLHRLHTLCADGTPVVTTTSSLPLPRLAIASGRPADTMGLRFLIPPGPQGPVQALRTPMTSPETAVAVDELIARLGLTPVAVDSRCAADATALVYAYLNRAMTLYERGEVDRHDIDTAMRLGCGLPFGPLELLDRIGLDTALTVLTGLWTRTDDDSFAPAPVLPRLVSEGKLGRKSGQGFYAYDVAEPAEPHRLAGLPAAPAEVRRVGVVGSGTMACGIAEVAATAGFPTVLVARDADKASQALARIGESLVRAVRRGRIGPQTKAAALDLLVVADDMGALGDCDLVIEAVTEDLDVKRALFARLGAVCRPGALLATTTSSLSVTACAEASGRPSHVLGMHFFNPAPAMRLVELVRTDATSDEAAATAQAVCERLGRTAVHCRDRVGFIVNYLLFPYLGRALNLLDRHDTDIEGIDTAIERGFGHPMGPFTLLDTIGLDVSLAIQGELYKAFGEPDFMPSPVLGQLVAAGWLGRKNRKGLRSQ